MGWKEPHEFSQVDMAFPACVLEHMPPMDQIPSKFTNFQNSANKLICRWFYDGIRGLSFFAREGIDAQQALIHLNCVLRSFEPKHQHKIAACAMLLDSFFDKVVEEDGSVLFEANNDS